MHKNFLTVILLCCVALLISCGGSSDASTNPSIGGQTVIPPIVVSPSTLPTTVTLKMAPGISPTKNELVTFGLPLAEGVSSSLTDIRVIQGNTELPIYVEKGLTWHWRDGSIRSVTIQLQNIDMTSGDVELIIDAAGRTTTSLSEIPHSNGWTSAGSDKANMPYPRVFAAHNTTYLAGTGIVPPYTPGDSNLIEYQSAQFDQWAGNLNYSSSTNGNWLFDRASAMFKAYLNSGDIKYLKEGFLSKQFYFTYVRDEGVAPAPSGGDGCWTFNSTACADGKYIQPQSAKLALALFGDDSQWDVDLINNMAFQADLGWNQYGTRDLYDKETEGFTERAAGLVGLAEINAYEITGNTTVLEHINERVSSLKDMQQTEKQWDIDNGWIPKSGAFTHSVAVHEGSASESSAITGDSNDRAFSPWMSENIADFLWHTYWVTEDTDIADMLRQLGLAIENYGFTTTYNSGTYSLKIPFNQSRTNGCSLERESTDLLYFGSAYASKDFDGIARNSFWPWYTDSHSVEVILPLTLAYYFESDTDLKEKLSSRIVKLNNAWIPNCSNVSSTPRLWNWQHRSNSVGTWKWVLGEVQPKAGGESVKPKPPILTIQPD